MDLVRTLRSSKMVTLAYPVDFMTSYAACDMSCGIYSIVCETRLRQNVDQYNLIEQVRPSYLAI